MSFRTLPFKVKHPSRVAAIASGGPLTQDMIDAPKLFEEPGPLGNGLRHIDNRDLFLPANFLISHTTGS